MDNLDQDLGGLPILKKSDAQTSDLGDLPILKKKVGTSESLPSELTSTLQEDKFSLKPKVDQKNYYGGSKYSLDAAKSTLPNAGLIFDNSGKLYDASSQVLSKEIPKTEEIDLNKPTEKDLVEKSREIPIEQPKQEEGSYLNIPANLLEQTFVKAADVDIATVKFLRNLAGKLPFTEKPQEIYDEKGQLTNYGQNIQSWDFMGKAIKSFKETQQKDKELLATKYNLPETTGGKIAEGLTGIIPDLAMATMTKGKNLFSGTGSLVRLGNALTGAFFREQAVMGAARGYNESDKKGAGETLVNTLKESGTSAGQAALFELAGLTGTKVGGVIGSSLKNITAKEAINAGSRLAVFTFGVPTVEKAISEGRLPNQSEVLQNLGIAGAMEAFHLGMSGAGKVAKKLTPTDESKAIKQINDVRNAAAFDNFMKATPDVIDNLVKSNKSAEDLNLAALDAIKRAEDMADGEEKSKVLRTAQDLTYLANIKKITELIANSPDALSHISDDLPVDLRDAFMQKAKDIHVAFNPAEQQKQSHVDTIAQAENAIKQNEALASPTNPNVKERLDAQREIEKAKATIDQATKDFNKTSDEQEQQKQALEQVKLAQQQAPPIEEVAVTEEVKPAEEKVKVGSVIKWDVFGNEEAGNWDVVNETTTRGGKPAVTLSKVYVTDRVTGKSYTKEYADNNGIKYDNEHVVEHVVPLADLQAARQPEVKITEEVNPTTEEEKQQALEDKLGELKKQLQALRSEDGSIPAEKMEDFNRLRKEIAEAKENAQRGNSTNVTFIKKYEEGANPETSDPKILSGNAKEEAVDLIEQVIQNSKSPEEAIRKIGKLGYILDIANMQQLNKYLSDRYNPEAPKVGNNKDSFQSWVEGKSDSEANKPAETPTNLEEEYNSKSVDELIALKKKLYPNPDIETAMTPEEKLLDKVIAKKFSEKNQEIVAKRKIAEEAPRFTSYDDAQEWIKSKSKEYKSKNEFLTSQEYKDALPDINALYEIEKSDYSKKAKQEMDKSGVKIGDRVIYDYVTPIGVETYSGQIIDRQGVPFVKFDEGQKTISGKQSVRWHKGFVKEVKPTEEKGLSMKGIRVGETRKLNEEANKIEPSDARSSVLKYLMGDNISQDAINELFGRKIAKLNTGERELKSGEVKARDYVAKKGEGESLDEAAHSIWDNLSEEMQSKMTTRDIKNELESAISEYKTKSEAAKALVDGYKETAGDAEEAYYAKIGEEAKEEWENEQKELETQLRKPLDEQIEGEASEEHINNLIKQYEAETKGENKQPRPEGEGKTNQKIGGGNGGEKGKTKESAVEQPEGTTSIKNKTTAEERANKGLDEIEVAAKRSFPEVFEKGKKLVDEGKIDARQMAKDLIQKPKALTAEESVALLYDRMKIQNEYKKLASDIENEPDGIVKDLMVSKLNQLEQDALVNDEAARKTGYEQGLGLAVRKMIIKEDYSLLNQLNKYKAANKGEDLTPEIKKKLQENVNKLEEAQKKFEEYEQQIKDLQAKKTIDIESKKTKKVNKTVEDFKKEREDIFKNIKDKWEGASKSNIVTAVPVPYSAQLAAISPEVLKLVKSYAEQGIVKLEDIVNDLHENISKQIPQITKRDVKDILAGEYTKEREKKVPIVDKEKMKLEANIKRIKNQIDLEKENIIRDKRSGLRKGVDLFQAWRRAALLSGVPVIGKIGLSGGIRATITTPIESFIGKGLSMIPGLSKVAAKSARESAFDAKKEAKAFSQLVDKATYQDVRQVLKTGRGELEELHDKKLYPSNGWLDFFGNLHAAIKVIPKRAEYFRALEYRTEYALKNGADISDPVVQQELSASAYADALRSIYMQENYVTELYKNSIKFLENAKGGTGKPIAEALKFILPIIKVPTNYVAEQSSYILGGVKALYALRKGISKLTSEEADYVMRALKKQSIGAAFLMLGYANPQAVGGYYTGKRRKDDLAAGDLVVFGVHMPHWALHTPLLEALQFGASIRRARDKAGKSYRQKDLSMFTGVVPAAAAVLKQVPFTQQAEQLTRIKNADAFYKYVGNQAQSVIDPQLIKNIAEFTDYSNGKWNKREAKTFEEKLKAGFPGTREQLKVKKE